MPLPSPKGHRIPLSEAAEQTKRYRDSMSKGGLFLRGELDDLLAQPGCSGLRFYYGRDKDGKDTLILLGVAVCALVIRFFVKRQRSRTA